MYPLVSVISDIVVKFKTVLRDAVEDNANFIITMPRSMRVANAWSNMFYGPHECRINTSVQEIVRSQEFQVSEVLRGGCLLMYSNVWA